MSDPRDAIWQKTYETYYQSYFYEMLADRLVDLWQATDELTKVLVAIAATGSAVSGWALWQDEAYKPIWALIAGTGTVLAIIHAALGVPGKLKDWEDFKRSFVILRIKLETLIHSMEINAEFSVEEINESYCQLRAEYAELLPRQKNDILKSYKLRRKTQIELNQRLGLPVSAKNGENNGPQR